MCSLYLPIKEVVEQALKALKGSSKTLLITGSPGMGKSLLAADLARQFLPGNAASRAQDDHSSIITEVP